MKGGVIIFSSANNFEVNPTGVIFPAAYDKVIAVAGIQPNFKKSISANCGSWVNISAPGGEVAKDLSRIRRDVYSTNIGNGYVYQGGTSMAAPHVTGVAALIVSHFGGKGYTNKDLKERLLSAKSTKYDIYSFNPEYKGQLGVGLIDAYAALVKNENQIPSDVTTINAKPSSNSIELEWDAVADKDDGTASKYIIYYSDQKLDKENYTSGKQMTVDASGKSAGDKVTAIVKNLESETEYFFCYYSCG
jgi:Subtilisin-like serine proteases